MRIGESLGQRYRLDARVDGGAMGEVWRGLDTRLNRTVAVKVLHAALSQSPEFKQRFHAEARAAAALRAPGVVDLYDYGEDHLDDGNTVSYLVMEYVDGRPLSAVLAEQGRIAPGDLMAIAAQCAAALGAAHNAGVIHRDVKPGNILLREDGEIRIVDFGIARAHGQSGLTSTGQVMGTVAYVSPEQLYDEELTGASDLYSLGIVMYECLSGRKPFNAEAPAAVIRAQLHESPPALPEDVPDEVQDVVARCLAKEPGDRWQSGEELAEACRALAAQLPRGGPTEPMSAVDRENETTLLRPAMPVAGTSAFPVDSGADGQDDSEESSHDSQRRKRRRITAAAVSGVLLLAVATAFVWQEWNSTGTADPVEGPESSESEEPESEPDPTAEDSDPGYIEDSTPVEPTSESPTSDDPTSDDPTSDDPTSDDPTSDDPSDGDPSEED